MMSIPECLSPKTDLYNHREQYNREYILKGVVTFSGSHYQAYIRNLKTKVKFYAEHREMRHINKEEGLFHNEWAVFDDGVVSHVSQHWKGIVEDCVSGKSQPTILLYEKICNDDKRISDQSDNKQYSFSTREVQGLIRQAEIADDEMSGD